MKINILQNIPNRALIVAYPDTEAKKDRRRRNKLKTGNKPSAPRSRVAVEYLRAVESLRVSVPRESFTGAGKFAHVFFNGQFIGVVDASGFKLKEEQNHDKQ